MALLSKNNFSLGINLDLDELRIPENVAVWIKDMTIGVNINASASSQAGSNKGVRTPSEGNKAITVGAYPSGTNYCIGTYSSEQTNELYYFLYNSSNNHSVWVINGDNGAVTKVYQNALLNFQLDPKYYISEGRCTIELRSYVDPVTGLQADYKFLIFTTNYTNQFFIEVNSSIATSSFSTSYFTTTAAFYNPLELIHLGVPTPLNAIGLNTPTAYVPTPTDLTIQNLLVNNGWQFRVKFIDIFGRESEHGIISNQYVTVIGGGCISTSNSLPRCLIINFDAGNPLVNQIQVEYRQWVGNDRFASLATGWQIYEVFNKYDNSTATPWYSRGYNPLFVTSGSGVTFNVSTNTVAYTFCADKNSVPIDTAETDRTEPGLPRISGGVFSINKRIGLPNNVRKFNQIPQDMVNKVVFGVENPSTSPCPASATRKITFYANIYSPYDDRSKIIRGSYGSIVFGDSDAGGCDGGSSALQRRSTSSFKLGQVFADQTNPGFIAYLAGTPYKCISEQGDLELGARVFTPVGYGPGIGSKFPHTRMQRFVINDVPAGKYIVRIASHKATVNDANYQSTSTYVGGIVPIYTLSIAGARLTNMAQNPIKEIEVDCTAGDVDLSDNTDPMFLILDLGDGVHSGAVDGYLYEAPGGAPVEMNPIELYGKSPGGSRTDGYGSFFTDHNGFYFCTADNTPCAQIWYDLCDGAGLVKGALYTGNPHSIQHGNGTGSITPHCVGDDGDWTLGGAVYISPTAYPAGARRIIKQFFGTCSDHAVGVPGIPTIMTKGPAGISDTSGRVSLVAHNRYSYASFTGVYLYASVPNYGSPPGNIDSLVFSQKGGCQWTDCAGVCLPYLASVPITYIACGGSSSGCTPSTSTRTFCGPNLYVVLNGINLSGCQTGGKYPVAFWLSDVIGRHTPPQVRQGQAGFVTMPNLNDVGYQQFALPKINVTIHPTFAVDPIFTKMTFLVGANILFSDFFSWAADWVQPVDNTGATNSTNPTAIRFYYGSLNEYNKQNNFSTNTNWQFLTSANPNAAPVEGDVVQFIMDGLPGGWVTSVVSAKVSYVKTGAFFTIPYLPELAGLKNNCLFRVIRPVKNESGDYVPFYEQSLTVKLVNGVPTALSFVLPYFDSYLLSREIPVPRMKGQAGPVSPSAYPITTPPIKYTSTNQDATLSTDGFSTNNINNTNGTIIFQTIDDPTTYPFYFESPSPSDTWGSHLACRGRVGVPNPYEQQQRIGTEVALSEALGGRGQFNGLSYYESVNVHVFDRNTWGNITTMLVETGVCLVICETDRFITQYNQTQLKARTDGTIFAQNQNGIFTEPQRKIGQAYGCIPNNINSIQKYGGVVAWVDNKGHVIFDNFSQAQPIEQQGYMGYLLNKLATINVANLNPGANGKTFYVACIDPKTMKYILTSFNLPASGSPVYGNALDGPSLTSNETYVFDLETGIMENSAAYTPEYYGRFAGYYLQRNFIAFKNGLPYSHHNTSIPGQTPPPFANYFGVQYLPRVTFVTNVDPERVKRYFYLEVYTKQNVAVSGSFPTSLFLADVITTESGQLSRILTPLWTIKDNYSAAAFISDLNTPADPNIPVATGVNKARDGNNLIGRWIKVSLVVQNTYTGTYYELSGTNVYINAVQQPNQK